MTVRAVLFDLGHTLWDIGPHGDELARAYADMRAQLCAALARDDLPAADALRQAVSEALKEASETYFQDAKRLDQPPSHTWVDAGCRRLGLTLDEEVLRAVTPPLFASETPGLRCADGTREALAALRDAGYALGCITNTLANGPAIRGMLRAHGLEELMSSVVVSADEGWRKPHPSLFEKALREVGAAPAEAVFVGDSPYHDIAGARRVGMLTVLTQQYVARDYGAYEAPDAVIRHISELRDVVAGFASRERSTVP